MDSKNFKQYIGWKEFVLIYLFLLFLPHLSVAKEKNHILTQSKLLKHQGSLNSAILPVGPTAADTGRFIQNVELSGTVAYSETLKNRSKEANMPFDYPDLTRFRGLSLPLLMALIAFSTLISEDLTCIGAGLMAARGFIGFWPATIACFLGILVGDMMLYLAGRWLGRPAIQKTPFKWLISEKDLKKSSQWFKAKGPAIILTSRFLPGSRLPTYFSAGVLGTGFWMFSLYFTAAAVLWTPILVGLSMIIGNELLQYFSIYRDYALWFFLAGVVLLMFIAKVIIPVFNYKGRRLLVARIKRFWNWEFWSPYIIYFPVCCYIMYLSFKHRSLTVFTAANPAIPDGGFIGESKANILRLFSSEDDIPRYILLDSDWSKEQQIETAQEFMKNNRLDFPVVIKPDEGQRGAGVVIARHQDQFSDAIKNASYDLIIQEYVRGEEYGVFYYRYPNEQMGNIFSVTTKKMLTLTGDGKSTLEELILDDSRAVCLAQEHFEYHENDLFRMPDRGEVVQLVELGTHARGAIFADGEQLITDKLRDKIDRISKRAGGFYFGRFDIRCTSEESFKAAENLQIIEVNGVSSESTNIYDKSNSFIDAQKILMEQWEIAFEIGTRNAKMGVSYSSISALLNEIVTYEPK